MRKFLPIIYAVVIVAVTTPMFYTQLSRVDDDNTAAMNNDAANGGAIAESNDADSATDGYLRATHFKIAPRRLRLTQYSKGTRHKVALPMPKGHFKFQQVHLLFSQQ